MLSLPTVSDARYYIWTFLQAALAQRACMELTTIRRFQRLYEIPLFDFFSALAKGMSLRYGVIVLGG